MRSQWTGRKFGEHLVVDTRWLVGHLRLSVAQMFTDVHGEGASAATEAVSLGTELAAIALLAPEGVVVGVDVGGVQSLVAEVALEADLVPLLATGEEFLSGVHGLVTLGADVSRHGSGTGLGLVSELR